MTKELMSWTAASTSDARRSRLGRFGLGQLRPILNSIIATNPCRYNQQPPLLSTLVHVAEHATTIVSCGAPGISSGARPRYHIPFPLIAQTYLAKPSNPAESKSQLYRALGRFCLPTPVISDGAYHIAREWHTCSLFIKLIRILDMGSHSHTHNMTTDSHRKLRIGVIGVGRMGLRHARNVSQRTGAGCARTLSLGPRFLNCVPLLTCYAPFPLPPGSADTRLRTPLRARSLSPSPTRSPRRSPPLRPSCLARSGRVRTPTT